MSIGVLLETSEPISHIGDDDAKYLGTDLRTFWRLGIVTVGTLDRGVLGSTPGRVVIKWLVLGWMTVCGQVNRFLYHRLNGSSSPVLTATSLSYGKAKKNSTPTESKPLTRLS